MKAKSSFKLKYCKTCLQTNTRPQSKIQKNGKCPACNYYFNNKNIDWNQRLNILKKNNKGKKIF